MKSITPLYKRAAVFAIISGAAAMPAFAQTEEGPYAGDVYWTQQKNNDSSGDTSNWGISINNETNYSPGDGSAVGEAFKEGEIDWENSNVFIDARFTGSDANGVNHVSNINPNHLGEDKTFTVKNFTIADNWDRSISDNKHSYWWDGNNSADDVTFKIKDSFNIYSAINGGGKNIHLDTTTINIDVSEKRPSDPTQDRGERNVNLHELLSLKADTVNVSNANTVNFSGSKTIDIGTMNVTGGALINLENAKNVNIGTLNVSNLTGDFRLGGSDSITLGSVTLTNGNWLAIQDSSVVVNGDLTLDRMVGFNGERSSLHVKGDFNVVAQDLQTFSSNSWLMKEEGFIVDGNFASSYNGIDPGSVVLNFDGSKRFIIGKNLSSTNQLELREDVYAQIGENLTISNGATFKYATWRNKDGTRGTTADNVGMLVKGMLEIDNAAMEVNFYNSAYSTGVDNYHMGVGGINTSGSNLFTVHLKYSTDSGKIPTGKENFSHTFVLNNAKDVSASAYLDIISGDKSAAADTNMSLHFIMNGPGKQQILTTAASVWKGSITVNNGTLQLFNNNYLADQRKQVDVTIGGNGTFGAIKNEDSDGSEDRSCVTNLFTLDGATLLYSGDDFALIVNEKINIEGTLTFEYTAAASEGDTLENFLEWTAAYDADNVKMLTDAFNDGRMQIRDINGTLYAVKNIYTNDYMLDLVVGGIIPEPATVAAVLGAFALAFAAYRRRK